MTYTIVKAEQTSWAAPAQWDAWTDDGRYLYLRYRHGVGTVEEQPDLEMDTWDLRKPPEVTFEHGDALDGSIELEEFARLAGITLAEDIEVGPGEPQLHVIEVPADQVERLLGGGR